MRNYSMNQIEEHWELHVSTLAVFFQFAILTVVSVNRLRAMAKRI